MSGNSRDIASKLGAAFTALAPITLTAYFTTKMQLQSHNKKIILASTSRYRKMLLERFPISFETAAPDADEMPLPGESPAALVKRLALAKARAVSASRPDAIVIGSDQVAECDGRVAGKPGSVQKAREQLAAFSGCSVNFLTALAVVAESDGFLFETTVTTEVVFRQLTTSEIDRYIALDSPLDCAGSFKSEATGTALLESMSSDDPSAIMGLPLIELACGLRAAGVQLP